MAKELPYFRFTVAEWLNDDISLESYKLQGVFASICAFYWFQDCSITKAKLKKRFSDAQEEIEALREKKQTIKEELYEKVKMEMFKASSKLEGIDYDKIPGTIKNLTHEQLQDYAWWLYRRVGVLERERKFSKVSRVEVIGPEKREYVRYFNEEEYMDWDLQDDDRTLKIFIEKNDE